MQPTNIHVSNIAEDRRRAAAGWEMDGARFHVWFDLNTHAVEPGTGRKHPTIYKNPLVERGEPGHFNTRYLDGSKPKNAALIEHVFGVIERDGLVAEAIKAQKAVEAERKRKAADERTDERRKVFRNALTEMLKHDRDEMYDALMSQLSMSDLDELQARLP